MRRDIHVSSGIQTHDLSVWEQEKTIHALDRAATVMGLINNYINNQS
jgi:hypothetical protein